MDKVKIFYLVIVCAGLISLGILTTDVIRSSFVPNKSTSSPMIFVAKQIVEPQIGAIAQSNFLPESEDNGFRALFFGDLMLDRNVKKRIEEHDFEYLLTGLTNEQVDFFSDYDIVSANLEGAVTNGGEHYNPIVAYDFAFIPDFVSQLMDYNFNFFTIANNHLADQGEKGIKETRANLERLGFDFVGCADRIVGECSVKVINANNNKIGLAAYSMVYGLFDEAAAAAQISSLASSSELVIVNIHWGKEYEHYHDPVQERTAHGLIDAGADLIIGHHPHVVQGIEIYKGKPIFYSLGNFIFDQYFSVDTQTEMALSLDYSGDLETITLMPLKSDNSQLSLITANKERDLFFRDLANWSVGEVKIKQQIASGKLIVER